MSFGIDAEAYDRTRPTYPTAVVDALAAGVTDAVDVGCGTGKLSRLLAERGVRVVGVEHDERMAAVARRHGVDVEVARFEDWDAGGRRFDLVTAAQAWHWVDPHAGAAKAAAVLRPGGRLAVVWNLFRHDPADEARLDEVYARLAPETGRPAMIRASSADEPLAGVDETGAFGPQERRRTEWQHRYTAAEWLDQLQTHSDHRLLPADRRAALLEAVAATVPDGLTITFTTLTISAVRA